MFRIHYSLLPMQERTKPMNTATHNQDQYLGDIQTKIVGMQYAKGNVHAGEKVHLQRDPENQHDKSAIQVQNQDFKDVGFIPRETASWLAPLIDQGKVHIEGTVPDTSMPHPRERHRRYPLVIHLYLCSNGASILDTNPSPNTDMEALHEIVLDSFTKIPFYPNPDIIQGLERRLSRMTGRDVLPETQLLLSLFPFKAEELKRRQSGNLIDKIREQLNRLKLKDGIHYRNVTLFPFGKLNGSSGNYVSLKKALESGDVEIEEVSEEGQVHELLLHNRGEKPVLAPEGEILIGAKQNRVINVSIIVAAHQSTRIPVSCVERGRWRYSSRKFQSAFYAHPKLRSKKLRSTLEIRFQTGEARSNQGEVWQEVSDQLHAMNASSATDSVTDGYQSYEERIKEYREKFSLPKETAGVLVCSGDQVVGLDYFGSPEMFHDCWERIADSYFMEAANNPNPKKKTSDKCIEPFLSQVRENIQLCNQSIGVGNELAVQGERITGAGVWHSDSLCHLSVFPLDQ